MGKRTRGASQELVVAIRRWLAEREALGAVKARGGVMGGLRCLGCGGEDFHVFVEGVPTLLPGQQACGDLVEGREIEIECIECGEFFRVGSVTREKVDG